MRRSFLKRRLLDRLFFDIPDWAVRASSGRSDWPPYSLRSYVGGASDFGAAGEFFRGELRCLGLLTRGARILDIGCGCGRIALALARDPEICELGVSYMGMDIDRTSVAWCSRHITPLNSRFQFYHADCVNSSYNPNGSLPASGFHFPHQDSSFDLVVFTSVLTHTLEDDLRHYLREASRLLCPGGSAYATFFLYQSKEELTAQIGRRAVAFPSMHGHYALSCADQPANAIAYQEEFIRRLAGESGLNILEPIVHGAQDVVLLEKPDPRATQIELGEGWYPIEKNRWRWTQRCFNVRMTTQPVNAATLRFEFRVPRSIVDALGSVRLKALVGERELPLREYSAPGEHVYIESLNGIAIQDHVDVRFELDRAYIPSQDSRELGVQVSFFGTSATGTRKLYPIRIEPDDLRRVR